MKYWDYNNQNDYTNLRWDLSLFHALNSQKETAEILVTHDEERSLVKFNAHITNQKQEKKRKAANKSTWQRYENECSRKITKGEKVSHLCCLDHCILADALLSPPLIFWNSLMKCCYYSTNYLKLCSKENIIDGFEFISCHSFCKRQEYNSPSTLSHCLISWYTMIVEEMNR